MKKINFSNILIALPMVALLTSCSKNVSISWIGTSEQSYKASYHSYNKRTIKINESLSKFCKRRKAKEMLAKDLLQNATITYGMQPQITFYFKLTVVNLKSNKFSFNIEIKRVKEKTKMLEMFVHDLDFFATSHWPTEQLPFNHVYFLPKNVTLERENNKENWIIQPDFWNTVGWSIRLNIYDNQGQLNQWYSFSYKTSLPDDRDVLCEYINFLCFQPFFFHSTTVVE